MKTFMVSQKLRAAVWQRRYEGVRQHELAKQAGLHPATFSQLLCDLVPVHPDDPRVIKMGTVLGLAPADCFDESSR